MSALAGIAAFLIVAGLLWLLLVWAAGQKPGESEGVAVLMIGLGISIGAGVFVAGLVP